MNGPMRDGGPAFPTRYINEQATDITDRFGQVIPANSELVYAGMSLRQFYAAVAPAAPEFFAAEASTVHPVPELLAVIEADPRFLALPPADQHVVRNWAQNDGGYELDRSFRAIGEDAKAAQRAAKDANAAGRFFAWRWHFADQMLKAPL